MLAPAQNDGMNLIAMMRGKNRGGLLSGLRGSVSSGWNYSVKGNAIFALPMAALAGATAPHGEFVSRTTGALSIGAGAFLGGMAGGLPGAIVGGLVLDGPLSRGVQKSLQVVHDFDRSNRSLHTGGGYQDTQAAYTMRQVAARELSGSLMNARQYLGKEGAFFHG